ncbi:MAG: glutamine--fructose-6-phosphate transaminase (isomerizing) [Candidatus Omnitrophica bacterium]|nr:glutamine--fructose-6-phosphate transaminase (isomerizing) [Candidatus Omnitrophota bacterium]MBU1128706.1 glutamine--fructose-6-phosphate transaminase (isomerizing) [Candidatus Omnitrophota bacterium]MBU1657258.1 glutamine--fructose-6-phosphate transaminase (isomerizing) [Candidatus Omnitrophota bacterium]MBU1784821.1 glutamine--fructose-6-phosphate transaminase (isomerizing) [Candidatus Omnitrophota bacterium]MBU1850983.1 glutamine--fructose-6-phosphate transaminase (isomerizing) [Candidat
MCGIIGYTGKRNAREVLINGLSRLEYRGYDSAGVAIVEDGDVQIEKKQGKLSVLAEELKRSPLQGTSGIGHTRWATHGVPNDVNAHPHYDHRKDIAIVHNGIIENYQELKKTLQTKGYKFVSETDSEVIAHLIADLYTNDLCDAVKRAVKKLKGSFAIAVVHKGEQGRIVGARKDSPLIAGAGDGEFFIASDIPAILEYTNKVIYLENGEVIDLKEDGITIYNSRGKKENREPVIIKWDIKQAEKDGYKHFMLKEIFEQPEMLRRMFTKRIKNGQAHFEELTFSKKELGKIKKIAIVACGTAYHAGMIGKYLLEKIAKIPVWVDQASEFRYRDPLVAKDTLVIAISQSGETADTLAGVREAKKRGAKVISICNVVDSSIARESHGVIYTHAGPEIAVASTKAYTAQIANLYLFTYYIASARGIKGLNEKKVFAALKKIPGHAKNFLEQHHSKKNKISGYAAKFHEYYLARNNKSCFLYLARNINYPNALEGALKLKEISYISAEGYPAGEMKHGPIALIDENPWVVCIATEAATHDKMEANIQEIKARGGIVIAIVSEGDGLGEDKSINYAIEVPRVPEILSPMLVAIPLQLLAYYVAGEFGYDIDQPRNLAKSVTVE